MCPSSLCHALCAFSSIGTACSSLKASLRTADRMSLTSALLSSDVFSILTPDACRMLRLHSVAFRASRLRVALLFTRLPFSRLIRSIPHCVCTLALASQGCTALSNELATRESLRARALTRIRLCTPLEALVRSHSRLSLTSKSSSSVRSPHSVTSCAAQLTAASRSMSCLAQAIRSLRGSSQQRCASMFI